MAFSYLQYLQYFDCIKPTELYTQMRVVTHGPLTKTYILAASRENLSSGFSDQVRHKPGCTATEDD